MSAEADDLAARIRELIAHEPGLTEKRMFGGLCFLINGNMLGGAMKSGGLLLRVGLEQYEAALQRSGAGPMNHAGHHMRGFIEVTDDGLEDEALAEWLDYALPFVRSLPPK